MCQNTGFPVFSCVRTESIRENSRQRKRQGYDQKRKLFRTNSFVLTHSSTKKIYNEPVRENPYSGIFYAV